MHGHDGLGGFLGLELGHHAGGLGEDLLIVAELRGAAAAFLAPVFGGEILPLFCQLGVVFGLFLLLLELV